jgi:homoserine O-acetyltransferase/O-succinyltransferase
MQSIKSLTHALAIAALGMFLGACAQQSNPGAAPAPERAVASTPAPAAPAAAQAPRFTTQESTFVLRDFRFHEGTVLPELKLHVTTLGNPSGVPVLILHGTTGNGAGLLSPAFGGELFGPGAPLDASRYFVILPDAIGHGKSSKPSDGLRARFPRYNYNDMVRAHHRLLTEHLGVKHLRLVLGNSMGGMETWLFAQAYPGFADIAVPMASLPVEMSGRNWMMRRLITDSIRNDPAWAGGNYSTQPASARVASVFYATATNGGNQALYRQAGTRAKADALLDQRLSAPFAGDANDTLYQWDSSRDYDASAGLERIQGVLLAINSADDERNPPELGVMERELARVKGGRLLLIPGSPQTAGHGTTGQARFWKRELEELLRTAPRLSP